MTSGRSSSKSLWLSLTSFGEHHINRSNHSLSRSVCLKNVPHINHYFGVQMFPLITMKLFRGSKYGNPYSRVPVILVHRAHDPSDLRQGSRALASSNTGSPPFKDFPSSPANLIGWEYETNTPRMLRNVCRFVRNSHCSSTASSLLAFRCYFELPSINKDFTSLTSLHLR